MYEIPTLLPARQAESLRDWHYLAWGGRAQKVIVSPASCYHFYVADSRFNRLWHRPVSLVTTGVRRVIEVNYSCYDTTTEAEAIYATYRKRWLSRYWQDSGLDVIVDLNVSERHARLNLDGVPAGWCSYSTRGYSGRIGELCREYDLALGHCGDRSKIEFLVYGGGRGVRELCEYRSGDGWWFVEDHMRDFDRERRETQWQRQEALRVVPTDRCQAERARLS